MSGQRSRDTGPELLLRSELHLRGLRYFVHRRPVPELRRTADIVFPRAKLAVFVDGCFWHGCPVHGNVPRTNEWYWPEKIERNVQRDAHTDRVLGEAGWKVIRIWEHTPVAEAADAVMTAYCDARGVN
jgi:DNA mismatch endonuclease (patch repair protein)